MLTGLVGITGVAFDIKKAHEKAASSCAGRGQGVLCPAHPKTLEVLMISLLGSCGGSELFAVCSF